MQPTTVAAAAVSSKKQRRNKKKVGVNAAESSVGKRFAVPPPLPPSVQARMVHLHNVHCIPLGTTLQLANVVEAERKVVEAAELKDRKIQTGAELRHVKRKVKNLRGGGGGVEDEAISFTQERPGDYAGGGKNSQQQVKVARRSTASTLSSFGTDDDGSEEPPEGGEEEEEFKLPDYVDSPYETLFQDVGNRLKKQGAQSQRRQKKMLLLLAAQEAASAVGGDALAAPLPASSVGVTAGPRRQSFARKQLSEIQQQQGVKESSAASNRRFSRSSLGGVAMDGADPTTTTSYFCLPTAPRRVSVSAALAAAASGGGTTAVLRQNTLTKGRQSSLCVGGEEQRQESGGDKVLLLDVEAKKTKKNFVRSRQNIEAVQVVRKGCARAPIPEEVQREVTLHRLLGAANNKVAGADGCGLTQKTTLLLPVAKVTSGESGTSGGKQLLPANTSRSSSNSGSEGESADLPVRLGVPPFKMAGLFQISSDSSNNNSNGGSSGTAGVRVRSSASQKLQSPIPIPASGLEAQRSFGTSGSSGICPGGSAPRSHLVTTTTTTVPSAASTSRRKFTPVQMQQEQEALSQVKHVYMNAGVQYGTGAQTHRPQHISTLMATDEERTAHLGGLSHRPVPPKERQTIFKPSTKFCSAEATLQMGSVTANNRWLKKPAVVAGSNNNEGGGGGTPPRLHSPRGGHSSMRARSPPIRNERGGLTNSPTLLLLGSGAGGFEASSLNESSTLALMGMAKSDDNVGSVGFTPALQVAPPFLALPSRPITVPSSLVMGYCTLVQRKQQQQQSSSSLSVGLRKQMMVEGATKGRAREGGVPASSFGSSLPHSALAPPSLAPPAANMFPPRMFPSSSHPGVQGAPPTAISSKGSSRITNMVFDDALL